MYYFNDQSIHAQFQDIDSFLHSFKILFEIKSILNQYDHSLYLIPNLDRLSPIPSYTMREVFSKYCPSELKIPFLKWITTCKPSIYDNVDQLLPENVYCYLTDSKELIIDSALSQCAWNQYQGIDSAIVSIVPSNYATSALDISLDHASKINNILIHNFIEPSQIRSKLLQIAHYNSWPSLSDFCKKKYSNVFFSQQAFQPLLNHPYHPAAAQKIMLLLDILEEIEGHLIAKKSDSDVQNKFKAHFSDASSTEKSNKQFKLAMTFSGVQCYYHGKFQMHRNEPGRIHFLWPKLKPSDPLTIEYIGPKLTKK